MGNTKPERPDLSSLPVRFQWVMRTSGGSVCESATSATELGEWARCFETAETILRVEIDDQENEDLSRCAKSTAQSIIVSWAKQHGRRGDLTLGMLQEHFKWYKGESGSEPELVSYRFGKESGFLRMLDRF